MLTSTKISFKLHNRAKMRATDNKGLSIVELIVVIAIMAVLIGLLGMSLSALFGTEASQAARKTEAQLNDAKTGAMTRAAEYMVIRYIDIDVDIDGDGDIDGEDQETMAKFGVDRSGFYAEKHISTLTNSDSSLKKDYGGVEYTRIASSKVTIKVGDTEILSDGSNGVKIEYDRRTGRLYDADFVTADGKASATGVDTSSPTSSMELTKMTFKAGMRTYEIDFDPVTGRHTIVN